MAQRIPWDNYEIALLLDAFDRTQAGEPEKKIAAQLSDTLRAKALAEGRKIDETFRNYNGMVLMLGNIQYLHTGGKSGLSMPSKAMQELYVLKTQHPAEFEELLREAKRMAQGTSPADGRVTWRHFREWLEEHYSAKECSRVLMQLADAEQAMLARKLLDDSLARSFSAEVLSRMVTFVVEDESFRFTQRGTLAQTDWAADICQEYLDMIRGLPARKSVPAAVAPETVPAEEQPAAPSLAQTVSLPGAAGTAVAGAPPDAVMLAQSAFSAWLPKQKVRPDMVDAQVDMLKNCQVYLQEKGILQASLFWETNPGTLSSYSQKLLRDPEFLKQPDYRLQLLALGQYTDFCRGRQHPILNTGTAQAASAPKPAPKPAPAPAAVSAPTAPLDVDETMDQIKVERAAFIGWLLKNGVSYGSVGVYRTLLNRLELAASGKKLLKESVYLSGAKELAVCYNTLVKDKIFAAADDNKKMLAVLKKFISFRSATPITPAAARKAPEADITSQAPDVEIAAVRNEQPALEHTEAENPKPADSPAPEFEAENEEVDNSKDFPQYERILAEKFPSGIRKTSFIDLRKFKNAWKEFYEEEFAASDDQLKATLAAVSIDTGERWYLPETLLSENDKVLIDQELRAFFNGSRHTFYLAQFYDQIQKQLSNNLLTQELFSIALKRHCRGKYYFNSEMISDLRAIRLNIAAEIENELIREGRPMSVALLQERLYYLPGDLIESALKNGHAFIRNTFGKDNGTEYFHDSMLPLSSEEAADIAEIINGCIFRDEYALRSDVIKRIATQVSDFADRASGYSENAQWEIIRRRLYNRFSFSDTAACRQGSTISVTKLLAAFCQTRVPFTWQEYKEFAQEIGAQPNIKIPIKYAFRIDKDHFIAQSDISFDVAQTDAAIALYFKPIITYVSDILSFDAFPPCGYTWNHYMLEQYIIKFSKIYKMAPDCGENYNLSGYIFNPSLYIGK